MIYDQYKANLLTCEIQNLDVYISEWLPLHMITAGFFVEVVNLLQNEDFLINRMVTTGIENSTRRIVTFVRSFEKATAFDSKSQMPSTIQFVKEFLCSFNSSLKDENVVHKAEIGRALILLGIQLQRFSKWSASLDYFTEALVVFRSISFSNDSPDIVRVSKYIDSCALRHVRLVRRDSPNKLRLKHVTAMCFREGVYSLELISHPGYAIVRMEDKPKPNIFRNLEYVFVGVGLKDSALTVNYDGQTIQDKNDCLSFCAAFASSNEGMNVCMITKIQSDKNNTKHEKENETFVELFRKASMYTIDPDGSIYPTMAPHLCLGTTSHPCLYLVARDSPNRAVFKFASDLQDSKGINDDLPHHCSFKCSIKSERINEGTRLELSSHPDMALVSDEYTTGQGELFKFNKIANIYLGPKKDVLSAKINDKMHITLIDIHKGLKFCTYNKENIQRGDIVLLSKYVFEKMNFEFVVNIEGTISPKLAQHLVLGFQVPGNFR
eukprot:CAMPEP_0194318976 /NCGR_PEP_ID=MMETSP0171-20130528/15502_1 /TAXON_ID=218684 /ORGANISM="Corethron pennatum, Strain L29A3" /LENGTH=493 /DNA_ID=CAMNT_0039076041 /DNA_START=161 /DNA_END=1642 /DNA_ORIENTATION=+